jgi:Xaa-Pro dipeptidase
MRITATISGNAHNIVMQNIKPDWAEYQGESLFLHETYNCGCRHQSYTPIFGGSVRSAILHYNANTGATGDGEIILIDAGAEYRGYTSDITRTYPVNGRFTDKQRILYQMVLNTQKEAIAALAPGVQWSAISQQAIRRIVEELKAAGFIYGDTDTLITKKVYSLFYPHSLGHMLGLQVHDPEPKVPVGIQNEQQRHEMGIDMISTLRPGMILTVEPGIYFIPALLEPAFVDPKYAGLLNEDLIRQYIPIGGVRIEDDLMITETGYEDFSAFIPKEIDEIEAFMAGLVQH